MFLKQRILTTPFAHHLPVQFEVQEAMYLKKNKGMLEPFPSSYFHI